MIDCTDGVQKKGFGSRVMDAQVFVDRQPEVVDAAKNSASDAFLRYSGTPICSSI
jgi:hypothetical protein